MTLYVSLWNLAVMNGNRGNHVTNGDCCASQTQSEVDGMFWKRFAAFILPNCECVSSHMLFSEQDTIK